MAHSASSKRISIRMLLALCLSVAIVLGNLTVSHEIRADEIDADTVDLPVTVTYDQSGARAMLDQINAFRTGSDAWAYDEQGNKVYYSRGNLTYDYNLEQIAMQRAVELIMSFDHTRPNGESPFLLSYGGTTSNGENIAVNQTNINAAFNQFLEEDEDYAHQGHRRIMLGVELNFVSVGIAHVIYDGVHYYVQEFGVTNSGAAATQAIDGPAERTVSALRYKLIFSGRSIDNWDRITYGMTKEIPTFTPSLRMGNAFSRSAGILIPEGSYSITDIRSSDTSILKIDGRNVEAVGAGSAYIYISMQVYGMENTYTCFAQVQTASVVNVTIEEVPDQYYTGSLIEPELHITWCGKELVKDVDYEVSWVNNSDVGSRAIGYISGKGNFMGSTHTAFHIIKCPLSDAQITVEVDPVTYNGTAQEPSVVVKHGQNEVPAFMYSCSYSENVDAGTGKILITANNSGYYSGTREVGFTIGQLDLQAASAQIEAIPDQAFAGQPVTPDVSVSWNGQMLVAGRDYTLSYENHDAPGTATVYVNGTGNFKGTLSANFTITGSSEPVTPGPGPVTGEPAPEPDPGTPAPQPGTPDPGNPDPQKPQPADPDPSKDPSFEDFVERLYTVALGRASEAEGKAFWVDQVVNKGFTGADCARFFLLDAPEFLGRGLTDDEFIEILYLTFFDRASEPDGKAYWMGRLASGEDRAVLVEEFIESTEWCNVCATYGVKSGAKWHKATIASKNAIKFATRLYTCCLGRDPEADGLNYWSLALTNLEATGYQAASLFFESPEFQGFNTTNEEYIRRLYTTFMDREADADGFNYWLGLLNNGTSRTDAMKAFASCPEFQEICNQYGIDRGEI